MNCTAFKFNPTTPFVLDKQAQFISATRIRNPHPNVYSSVGFSFTRKKLKRSRHFAPPNATSLVELDLPLLPFPLKEVLVPSESKALHLYEARYLALLEESLTRKKLFVHFVLDPIIIDNSSGEGSFAARNGCLVFIENVEHLEVGALVSIRGIGRVKIVKFVQADPYLKGVVIPVHDRVPESGSRLDPKVMQVKEALYSLNSLELKLKIQPEQNWNTGGSGVLYNHEEGGDPEFQTVPRVESDQKKKFESQVECEVRGLQDIRKRQLQVPCNHNSLSNLIWCFEKQKSGVLSLDFIKEEDVHSRWKKKFQRHRCRLELPIL